MLSLPQSSVVAPQAGRQRSTGSKELGTRLIKTVNIDGVGVVLLSKELLVRVVMPLSTYKLNCYYSAYTYHL